MKRGVGFQFRRAFLAGLLVLVPFAVTVWVLVFLVSFLESVIHLLPDRLQPEALFGFPIPGLGVLLAISTVLAVGFGARSWSGNQVVRLTEWAVDKVPVMNSVYSGVKQLMEALFAADAGTFSKVALVEWPRKGAYALAFLTGDAFLQRADGRKMVNVFLPTTPNPTTGFFFLMDEADVVLLDISVEEGFKLIMSAGLVAPPRRVHFQSRSGEDDARFVTIPPPPGS
jgi:uncharacterized membrane protein